jgi:hypothetical protein
LLAIGRLYIAGVMTASWPPDLSINRSSVGRRLMTGPPSIRCAPPRFLEAAERRGGSDSDGPLVNDMFAGNERQASTSSPAKRASIEGSAGQATAVALPNSLTKPFI